MKAITLAATAAVALFLAIDAGANSFPATGNVIIDSGNLGIDTATPAQKLHVRGSIHLERPGGYNYRTNIDNKVTGDAIDLLWDALTTNTGFGFRSKNQVGGVVNALGITSDGEVGIRTFSPVSELHVVGGGFFQTDTVLPGRPGNIRAEGVITAEARLVSEADCDVGADLTVVDNTKLQNLPLDNSLTRVVVAAGDGLLHTRDASTLQGADGTNGTNGTNGADGATGAQGPQGKDGAQGPAGSTGSTGPAGLTGTAGADAPCVDCVDLSPVIINFACKMLANNIPTTQQAFDDYVDAVIGALTITTNVCGDKSACLAQIATDIDALK